MLTKPSLSSGFVEKGLPEPWMTPEAGGEKQDGRQLVWVTEVILDLELSSERDNSLTLL